MDEADLNKKAAERIRKRGGWARKMVGGLQSAGLPDVIGVYRQVFLGLEGKLPGKEDTLTKLQAKTLEEIKAAGGVARMYTSVEQVDKLLDAIDKKLDGGNRKSKKST
jgi:hypothetical protein